MTQLEKDRLIEKFMGWKITWKNGGWVWVDKDNKSLAKTCYADSTLGFTTDWNWLMMALKRFDELTEMKSPFTIGEHQQYSSLCDQIDYAVTLYNIGDAVNALCEGIEWYNKTLN